VVVSAALAGSLAVWIAASRGHSPAPAAKVGLKTYVTHQADGYALRFRYPANWRVYPWMVVSTMGASVVDVSTAPQHNPCTPGRCGLSINHLERGGVWLRWGVADYLGVPWPGDRDASVTRLANGWYEQLRITPAPNEGFAGADLVISASIAPTRHATRWWGLSALLRGPNEAANTRAVLDLLRSTQPIRA